MGTKTRAGVAFAALLLLTAPAGALSLDDLDLEQLMDLRLNTVGITDIGHTHPKGEWMVSLRTMGMHMDGNRDGTSSRSTADVLRQFPVAPVDMDMFMTMLHVMYAPTEKLTLMGMLPYGWKRMSHVTRMGRRFTTRTDGLGDVRLLGRYELHRQPAWRVIGEMGFSFPTGSISERDRTPMGEVVLPYPMQLGSGSVDLRPALSYLAVSDHWAWGIRAGGTVRLHENRHDYRLGHEFETTGWLARSLLSWLSASVRLEYRWWGDISGADPRLNPALVPTADPDLRGGQRLDVLFGLNVFGNTGALGGHRVAFEVGLPTYQNLHGPQLETDLRWSAEWSYTF